MHKSLNFLIWKWKVVILPTMLDELNIKLQKLKLMRINNASEDDVILYYRSQFTNNYKVKEK